MTSKLGRGYVPGTGKINPEIAIVGQSVGKYELQEGKPFSGPAGDLLDEALEQAGINRADCWITNVLKYQPFKLPKIGIWEDFDSIEALWKELEQVNPKKILALGNIPLWALTGNIGINDWRGSILRSQRLNRITVATFNPAHLLYTDEGGEVAAYWQKYIIDFDINKLKRTKLDWVKPNRRLTFAKSSLDLYRFLERAGTNRILSVDIEVIKCLPSCIGLSFSPMEAISVPLFREIAGVNITTIPELDLCEIWRLVDKALRNNKIVGHNFKFDQERLEKELIFKIPNFHADTMLMAAVLQPELPKSLAFLASIHTDEPFWKNEGKEFNPKKDKIDQHLLYNAKDAAVTREIYDVEEKDLRDENLSDYYFGYYNNLHNFYYEMESIGLCVDEEQRKKLIEKYQAQLEAVNERFKKILTWVPNVNSPKDVPLVVYEHLRLPKRESLNEDSLVSLLANHAKNEEQRIILQSIIDARRLRKILGPDKLLFAVDYDGKARTNYRIAGTETGRSSTSVLSAPIRPFKVGLPFQTMSKHGDVGKDFRSMIVPPKGMVFINVDQSQAEARIVALLAEDYDMLELFDLVDVHRLTYAAITEMSITKKYPNARSVIEHSNEVNQAIAGISGDQRFGAKKVRHGGNYDMGKRELMLSVNTDARKFHIDFSVSEWKAGKLLEAFHKFTPKIREVFHKQIKDAIYATRELVRVDGSKRTFFDRMGPKLFKEAYADIPQNTVAHQTKRAGLDLKKLIPGIPIVGESHDALLVQWWENEAEQVGKELQKLMSRPIDFSRCSLPRGTLVIPADIEIGYNYADLKKVKL